MQNLRAFSFSENNNKTQYDFCGGNTESKPFNSVIMKALQLLTIVIAIMSYTYSFNSSYTSTSKPNLPQKEMKIISNVETNGSWVYLYDEQGHRYKTLSASNVGEVKGFSSTFFVSEHGSWVYLWNSKGDRYKFLPKSNVGDVIGVAGNTFTSRNGHWIYTWSSDGSRINYRPAR